MAQGARQGATSAWVSIPPTPDTCSFISPTLPWRDCSIAAAQRWHCDGDVVGLGDGLPWAEPSLSQRWWSWVLLGLTSAGTGHCRMLRVQNRVKKKPEI